MINASEYNAQPPSPSEPSEPSYFDRERNERNRALITAAHNEDERAMETLVVENAGLVRSLALRFCGRGTEYEDLIQIGTIGLIKAIRSFDLERGTAFPPTPSPSSSGRSVATCATTASSRSVAAIKSWAHSSCACITRS